ncbi:hypothetical protein ACFL5L_03190 [candidate division KSB1 bacterium]
MTTQQLQAYCDHCDQHGFDPESPAVWNAYWNPVQKPEKPEPQEITLHIEPLKYRRKTVDNGYIIGTRRYMSQAKRGRSPLWARCGCDFISEIVFRRSRPDNVLHTLKRVPVGIQSK